MYCGSCLRDNTLAGALMRKGHDVLLVPTYTPIRTDEEDVSIGRVFYGALNVYLQQKSGLFRSIPTVLGKLLDSPRLLRAVSKRAAGTDPRVLGEFTLSVLRGRDGHQRRELEKLAAWLENEARPDIVVLPNAMFAGIAAHLRERLKVPVLCSLTGEDVFLEQLSGEFRQQAIDLIRSKARDIDGFLATSGYYADFSSEYFQIDRRRIHVVYPGLNLEEFDCGADRTPDRQQNACPAIGFLARICPEKGLHELARAFIRLRKRPNAVDCRLKAAGYLSPRDRPYLQAVERELTEEGLGGDFEYLGTVDHSQKVEFLQSLAVFSVPTTYREPKGIFLLEAWACGVAAVQPAHGSFPELVNATGGGLLVMPGDTEALADGLAQLLTDTGLRNRLGAEGRRAVRERFSADRMAGDAIFIFRRYVTSDSR
jgi:glycosyltransferase involved in cell wall biosynthesis